MFKAVTKQAQDATEEVLTYSTEEWNEYVRAVFLKAVINGKGTAGAEAFIERLSKLREDRRNMQASYDAAVEYLARNYLEK